MKLAVFKDYGIGRYFSQLFDSIPNTILFIAENNKSGLNVSPHPLHILHKKNEFRHMINNPLSAWIRHRKNNFDKKKDFFYFEIKNALDKGAFDIAITGSDRSLYTLASLKAEGYKFKLIYWIPFTIPFVDVFDERSFFIRDFSFNYIDHFVAITKTCKEVLLLEGIKEEKITHIYPGIDISNFTPGIINKNKFQILFVGKLVSWKGCYTLIYAAKLLIGKIKNLEILFVGQGAQQRKIQQVATLLGVEKIINFLGHVEYNTLPEIYRQASLFVLPSLPAINLAEQFGFVVAEAMASGCPVLVSKVGGLPEVIGFDENLMFTPGNYQELAEKILYIYNSPDTQATISAYCLERAQANFDAEKNGAALHNLLKNLN